MSGQNRSINSKQKARLRFLVILYYGTVCWICGKQTNTFSKPPDPQAFTMDHVIPYSMCRSWKLGNLRPAHYKCNQDRHREGKK